MAKLLEPTPVEARLVAAIQEGRVADFSDAATDPERTVRGPLFTQTVLALKPEEVPSSNPIRLRSVIFTGKLNFDFETIQHRLEFHECRISEPLHLRDAHLHGLRFHGGEIAGIRADRAQFGGALYFGDGLLSRGEINLTDAHVSGAVEIDRARFERPNSDCLNAPRVVVDGFMELRNSAVFEGCVNLADATVKGGLTLDSVQLINPTGVTVRAERATIGVGLRFWNRFSSVGQANLSLAKIGGKLEFRNAEFRNEHSVALLASGCDVSGPVLFGAGFRAFGQVNLSYATIKATLECDGALFSNPLGQSLSLNLAHVAAIFIRKRTEFSGEVNLVGAELSGPFNCEASKFSNQYRIAIRADGFVTKSSLIFQDGCSVEGAVRLQFANVGATFECHGVRFSNHTGQAIEAYEMKTGDTIHFRKGFHAQGEVRLTGAEINGNLEIENAVFENPQQTAFRADGAHLKGGLLFTSHSIVRGAFSLNRCQIDGSVEFRDGEFEYPSGNTLTAAEMTVLGSVTFFEWIETNGTVNLRGADIRGALSLAGARFRAVGRAALQCDNAKVGQSVVFQGSFHAAGEVSFIDAQIGGGFDAHDSTIENRGGRALSGARLSIASNLHLRNGFAARGQVYLYGCKADYVDCSNGIFENPGQPALVCTGLQCTGDAFFDGAQVNGGLDLRRARIGGNLSCRGIRLQPDGERDVLASGLVADGTWIWRGLAARPQGLLDFSGAKVTEIDDDANSWPVNGRLMINNFRYEALSKDSPLDRRPWIRLQTEYNSQPYEQAFRVLQQMGRDREARRVAIAKQDDLRRKGNLGWPARFGKAFLGVTIGYGYQVWKALLWAVAIILVGWVVFLTADQLHVMQPQDQSSGAGVVTAPAAKREFVPLVYSLDNFIPAVDLYLKKTWAPIPMKPWHWIFVVWRWIEILSGWLLTSLFLAGLGGLVKKN